jgi:hypothetical protein
VKFLRPARYLFSFPIILYAYHHGTMKKYFVPFFMTIAIAAGGQSNAQNGL